MAFCAKCGAQVNETYCQNCGASASASASHQGAVAAAPAQTGGLSTNAASALAYLLGIITGVIFVVMEPYNQNPTVRFHAWQSIFFTLAWIAFWIGMSIITSFLSFLALVLLPIELLISFGGFCFWLFLMWKAYNGVMFEIPVVAGFAKKQAGL